MNADEKFNLITRNLQETLGEEDLRRILETRNLNIYWGTATTGQPHVAYFLPILKIKDFLTASCRVKILLADIHAFLDNLKAPLEKIEVRTKYYEILIKAMLRRLSVDLSNISFIRGSTFQNSPKYTFDLFKILAVTTGHDALKAGCQVVKQVESPMLSSMIYPSMQALDEEYLNVDAQFGGVDQRKIFTYARKHLPLIGYEKRIHLMNPMIPGLNCQKMSSSDQFSKIDFLDTKSKIDKKIRKCFCEPGNINTGLLPLLKMILFPIFAIINEDVVIVNKEGIRTIYKTYEELEKDFMGLALHPSDLKASVTIMLDTIIAPIREEMVQHSEVIKEAYC